MWNTALSSTTINSWKDKQLASCHPNAANLVLYWPLDNSSTSGTAIAGLTTTYAGTITNGTYVTSAQASTPGNCPGSTKAISFASGQISTTGDVAQVNSVSKISIETYFKYDAPPVGSALQTIYRKSAGGTTNRLMMHLGSNNQLYVMVSTTASGNTYGFTANNAVSAGSWYHVAVVYDGTLAATSRLKLYINGVATSLTFSGTIPTTTGNNTSPFIFGGEPGCCYLNGTIDEIRVWNTALSSGTITTWKDKELGSCHPNAANLVLYWQLDDNTNPAVAAAGLNTTYTGNITNGTYVASTQADDASGCGSPSMLDNAEGVQNVRRFEGKLYPNPARGIVRVGLNAPSSKMVTVIVIDMQGRIISRNQTVLVKGHNNLAVDISSLRSGTYFIEVKDGKSSLGKYKMSKQ